MSKPLKGLLWTLGIIVLLPIMVLYYLCKGK